MVKRKQITCNCSVAREVLGIEHDAECRWYRYIEGAEMRADAERDREREPKD